MRAVVQLVLASAFATYAAAAPEEDILPVLIIPGYASSQLHAWRSERCGALGQDVSIGDRVWVNVAHLIAQKDCWIKCMSLHVEDQSDVSCKLRAGEGISSIAELAPGLFTGPMSIVWRNVIETLTGRFDLGPHQLLVASYDWRLPPSKLQERDLYFYSMQQKIEDAVGKSGSRGIVVLAHSLGNSVFRYFLAWLKKQIPDDEAYQRWIDRHIASYFAVGAPFLGSTEIVEAVTAGGTVSIPLSKETLRELQVTYGSTQWMLPFPRDVNDAKANETLVTIHYKSEDTGAHHSHNFTLHDITNGNFHRRMRQIDPHFDDLAYIHQQYYVEDPVLNPLTPWTRPPIKSVHVVYGVGLSVRHRLTLTQTGPGQWETSAAEGEEPDPDSCDKTGDGTVSYDSLSWGHTWLGQNGDTINVTRIPQAPFFSAAKTVSKQATRLRYSTYESSCSYDRRNAAQPRPKASTNSGFLTDMIWSTTDEPAITFFEYTDSKSHTSVWELDQVPHREILTNPAFLRELKHELEQTFITGGHASKTFRPPHHDTDCYWNYLRARCEYGEYCQYDYKFGDVTLDQSCRIKKTLGRIWLEHQQSLPPTKRVKPDHRIAEPVFKHMLHEYAGQCPHPPLQSP
ncbi:hypothetical protein Ae201684P_006852 [Aphanomyces euteiches]|uniref:Uncharacterized protein n=1 Tax=Aphanomyces euteiches TaxID=100861 RepID=A0A6G0X852_9STRA|nr:hypothetical protein Ae201684_007244 [Aphanomyces euteiches]KAH9100657.1 hypothetical protein Ae201684P_006852 [Aphanomyces euteiches]KAH9155776.1 hypothetical protein AeRB84_002273 [Aphanomyces euteiches]